MIEWEQLVKQEIMNWCEFHRFWIKEGCYFLRFEDLTKNLGDTLSGCFMYLLDLETLDGTEIQS
jgi:hypothetical protein